MEKGLISVDRWGGESQAYFLTHLHSDHTSGLSSSWSKGPIFCSRLTAKLFPFKFPGFSLSLLRIVSLGSWHSISLVSPSSGSRTAVDFLAIDAHHCPGAVMFLFRGDFGCFLYTGDFRWESTSERANQARSVLVDALNGGAVDILYLDNTYCNPSYDFPSREVAAKQVVDIIASHPDHDIIIGIDTLGKEDLLVHIARALNIKVCARIVEDPSHTLSLTVYAERLQTMHLLRFDDIFTTKTSLTRVRAVPRYSFSVETLEGLNTMRPTIGIMPSGLPWVVKPSKGNDNLFGSLLTQRYNKSKWTKNDGAQSDIPSKSSESPTRFHKYIYSVRYSEHSSYSEIGDFVNLVQPANMKGIVSSSSCYVDPMYYFGRLCRANQQAQWFRQKCKRKEQDEITLGTKSTFGNVCTVVERNMGRNTRVKLLRAQTTNRVTAHRRVRCGAKIPEEESRD